MEIRLSPAKILVHILAGIVCVGLLGGCAAMGLNKGSPWLAGFGALGLLYFGFITLRTTWLALSGLGRPVIVVSQEGIRDVRVAKEVIPWAEVHQISTGEMDDKERALLLSVNPALASQLTLTALGRRMLNHYRKLGEDRLCITVTGLAISFERLFTAAWIYGDAARGAEPAE